MSFGRLESNDCVLSNDAAISRKHFEIFFKDGGCWLADLNSRNGTYLNNYPIVSSQINSGDEILAGNTRLLIRLEDRKNRGGEETLGPHVSASPLDIAAATSLRTIDQEMVETLLPGINKDYEVVELGYDYVKSRYFSRLICDLPGAAILVNHPKAVDAKTELDISTTKIDTNSYLFFPTDEFQVKKLIEMFGESDSILFLNHQLRRSVLVSRLQDSLKTFSSASAFWGEIGVVPEEIALKHMAGIDFVAGKSPARSASYQVMVANTLDHSVVQELVESFCDSV